VYELTPAINLWAVSMTLANNFLSWIFSDRRYQRRGHKFLTGDNDIGNKFIAGVNNTGEQLSPVTTPVNYYRGDHDTGDK
jgi:hypothetical protein